MKIKSIRSKIIISVVGLILFFGTLATTTTYVMVRNLLSSTNQEEALATNAALVISGFVIVAAIVAAIVISIVIRKFSRPLFELLEIADAIKSGDLNRRADVQADNELGALAASFNQMADQLMNEKIDVEKKIEKRTQELEKLNQSMVGRELKMIELKKKIASLSKK